MDWKTVKRHRIGVDEISYHEIGDETSKDPHGDANLRYIAGLHVISTRVGGVPEILPAHLLTLTEPHSASIISGGVEVEGDSGG